MKASEYLAALRQGARPLPPVSPMKCASCDVVIQESITGCRSIGGGRFACSDCYYDELSDALEAQPVLPPRLRARTS